ncbi:hypothetical protein DFH07DRAFT_968382 [Mycena maculata]|uniref:Uncharacterized protein n=1 Tax=Mycena maculata TaxID=230809 RepID=A0AAD7MTM3_9AGAR|nr:hypothetical protein DFH07DRAFT_968382 [Mycena maculata]
MPNPHNNGEIYESLALQLYCAAAEAFTYGINLILFSFCIKTLRTCRVPHRRVLCIAVSLIFVFCTLQFALELVNAAELMMHLLRHSALAMKRWNQINTVMDVLYVTNNLIADGIFIYRCYCIWNFSKRIIAVPIVLLIATGCLGYASIILCGNQGFAQFLFITWVFPLSVLFSVATNVLLMALTAGRIWWIALGARIIMGPEVVQRYRTVIAMILESGALFVIPGLLYAILAKVAPYATVVIFAVLVQVMVNSPENWLYALELGIDALTQGIAPTIIVVRVGLGSAVDSVQSFRAGGHQPEDDVIDVRPDGLDYLDGKESV